MENNHKPNSPEVLDRLKEVIEQAGLTPVALNDAPGFAISFKDDGPPVAGLALVYEEDRRFIFYLEFEERAEKKLKPEVAEFITRANFGMTFGNFEMDYESGLVRYKTSMDYTGGELLPLHIRNVILGAMEGVEVYAEGLIAVLKEKKTPKQAILDAESVFDTDQ